MNYNELNNLKTNGSASLGELKEFLAKIKGRDPQEVIGIVSTSLLIQSLVLATVGTVIFMAVFTVIPYYFYGPPKATNVATKSEPAAPAAAQGTETKPAEGKLDPAAAAKALGVDEAKEADPKKNPLDKGPNIDKLLDGLDK